MLSIPSVIWVNVVTKMKRKNEEVQFENAFALSENLDVTGVD